MTTSTRRANSIRVLLAIGLLGVFAGPLHAQGARGSITGRATDSLGAVVPGVTVSARNTATNISTTTLTNETGNYTILYLIPGVYDLTVELKGFTTLQKRGIKVQVGDKVEIDFTMQPGELAETVVVSANRTPLLSTESGSSGTVIGQRQISELPLPFGNPFMLAALASGVVVTAANLLQIRPFDNGVVANIRTDGAPGGNDFTLDGAPNGSVSRGTQKGTEVAYIPPTEAVEEFKMETAAFSARQGHAPGAAVNVSLKSGTNEFHGGAWEFTRPPSLVANDFYLRRAGKKPSDLTLHRFGGSVGGPVIIPRLYDGRNRTFFFFTYENMITDQPSSSISTVPTEAERRGDFSALLSQNILIYNPFSGASAPGGRVQRTPFPGNIIPSALLSPIAQNVLGYYPLPNAPGNAQGADNYVSIDTAINRFNSEILRVDHHFDDKNHLSARFNRNFRDSPSIGWSGGLVNGINPSVGLGYRGNDGFALDHVLIASPTDLINATAGITRYYVGNKQTAPGFDPASLGFPASTVALFNGARYLPSFGPSGTDLKGIGSSGGDFLAHNTIFLKTSYTKIRGKHSLDTGYELRVDRENNSSFGSPTGTYSFGNNYTKGPFDNSAGAPIGQGLASLLLGLPTGGSIVRGAASSTETIYHAVFLQDDFKVTPRLTLNLGLRYEFESPTTERFNRNVRGFDLTSPSPIDAAARAAYTARPDPALAPDDFHLTGGLLFADPSHSGFWDTNATALQPRVGAAFQITPKTVLRGGWGLYMIPFGIDGVNQPGFSQTTAIVPTLDNGLTFVSSLATPFPNGVLEPVGAAAGLSTNLGQAVSFIPSGRKTGKAQRWQVGLQRELPGQWVVEVIYAGTRGYDMAVATNLNAIPSKYLSTSPIRDQATINFLTAQIPNPMAGLLGITGLSGATIARSQILLPFPQFTAVNSERDDGSTRYQGIEIRASHRFQSGYTLNASYSHSSLRERLSQLNSTDASPEDRVSTEDRPNRFTVNAIWELPFGKGRKFGREWHGFVDGFLGGWQLNGVYVIQSGRPLTIGNLYFTGDPNTLKATYDKHKIDSPLFDISQFYFHDAAVQTNGVDDPVKQRNDPRIQLSNNIRTLPSVFPNLRGDRIRQLDASLIKMLQITERVRVQIRLEVINLLNQVQFGDPNLAPTNANFGTVTASSQLNPPRTGQLGLKVLF